MPGPVPLNPTDMAMQAQGPRPTPIEPEAAQESSQMETLAGLLLQHFSPEDISKIPGLNVKFQSWDKKPPKTIKRKEFDNLDDDMQSYLMDKAQNSKGLPPYDYKREYAQGDEDPYRSSTYEEGMSFPYVEEKDRVINQRVRGTGKAGFVNDTYHMPPEVIEDQMVKRNSSQDTSFRPTSKDSLIRSLTKQLSKKADDTVAKQKKEAMKAKFRSEYEEEMKVKQRLKDKPRTEPSPLSSTTYPSLPEYIKKGIPAARAQRGSGNNYNKLPNMIGRALGF